jgi:Kinesin motor domain
MIGSDACAQVMVRPRPPVDSGLVGNKRKLSSLSPVDLSQAGQISLVWPESHFRCRGGPAKARLQTFPLEFVASHGSQEAYYKAAVYATLADFLQRPDHDCAILAYGATGSGKTYTMQGSTLHNT